MAVNRAGHPDDVGRALCEDDSDCILNGSVGSADECKSTPSGCRPSDQANRLGQRVRLCRLLSSTPTIAIYYYSAGKLTIGLLILPSNEG